MIKLLILADDFTGALDTGVQFSQAGVVTLVSAGFDSLANLSLSGSSLSYGKPPDVLVLDLETRHLPSEQARKRVQRATELAVQQAIPHIYKKFDSALRGNIGGELEGLLTGATEEPLVFVPAYPENDRITISGSHFVGGLPVTKSIFANDPFTPVLYDYIPDIIAQQTKRKTNIVTKRDLPDLNIRSLKGQISVFDASGEHDMVNIASVIKNSGTPKLMAGCAGFAKYLPDMLDLSRTEIEVPIMDEGLLVVCGSINANTLEQVGYASRLSFTVVELTPEQKMIENFAETTQGNELITQLQLMYKKNRRLIIQAASDNKSVEETNQLARQMGRSPEESRKQVATNLGQITGSLLSRIDLGTLVVFGGDTLMSVLDSINQGEIYPIKEVQAGVAHSTFMLNGKPTNLITKSGGFGQKNCIMQIEAYAQQNSLKYRENLIAS